MDNNKFKVLRIPAYHSLKLCYGICKALALLKASDVHHVVSTCQKTVNTRDVIHAKSITAKNAIKRKGRRMKTTNGFVLRVTSRIFVKSKNSTVNNCLDMLKTIQEFMNTTFGTILFYLTILLLYIYKVYTQMRVTLY